MGTLAERTAAEVMLDAYLNTILFAEVDDQEPNGEPLDASYTAADFHPDARAKAAGAVESFLAKLTDAQRGAVEDRAERAGADLWFTMARHGCGFWDGDWPVHGDALTEIAHSLGEPDVQEGDDGKLHLFP